MIKERVWPVRVMYMLIAAALAISLIITTAPALKVSAQEIPDAEWELVDTPTTEGWVIAPWSYIVDYAVGEDGEVAYAIVYGLHAINGSSGSYLVKSDDHAATWEDITPALEDVLDENDTINAVLRVACDPEDSDFVAVALYMWDASDSANEVHVFVSTDGGATFRDTGEVEDGAMFLSGWYVTDLDVSTEDDGERDIAIVGSNGTVALIFRCTAVGEFSTGWEDARYPGWDNQWVGDADTTNDITSLVVTDVKFAPSWGTDKTILVTTVVDEDGSPPDNDDYYSVHLQYGTWGTTEGWNEQSTPALESTLITDTPVRIPYCVAMFTGMQDFRGIAGLTMPLDFAGRHADKRVLWVWVNYYDPSSPYNPKGTIYRVKNGDPMGIGWQVEDEKVWLTNVSYLGYISEGKAIAGVLGTGGYAYNTTSCFNSNHPYWDLFTDCCEGVQVYRNDNIVNMDICCYDWEPSCKPPTGTKAMAAFYVSDDPASSKAYAVALWGHYLDCDEGAWSVSFDDGDVWNQLSLITTCIEYLSDVAVSPDCNKTMLVSVNNCSDCDCEYCDCCCDSVWLRAENLPEAEEYSGKWLRTWCGMLTVTDAHDHGPEWGFLRLAPEETTGDTVYFVDYYTDIVYWNEMETLGCWEDGTATVDHIVDLAVKDRETIYALDYDGTVAMSDDFALGWHEPVDSEVDEGFTIAVWGDHILVGGCDGDVSYSDDGGETFTKLEDVANSGCVTVAFDSYFDTNNTVYAAVCDGGGDDNGIYSFVIDESETWKDLRAEPTRDALCCCNNSDCSDKIEVNFTGLVVDTADGNPMTSAETGGVLYASFCLENDYDITGVARRLNPAEVTVCPTCVEWDYLMKGMCDHSDSGECPEIGPCFDAYPDALKICGCLTPDTNSKLFAVDTDDWCYDMYHPLKKDDCFDWGVWMFEDCYAKKAPDLIFPADGATIASDPCECIPLPFTLRWDRLCDACSYDIQIALDEDFNEVMFDSRWLCNYGDGAPIIDPCCTYVPAAGETPSFPVTLGPDWRFLICEFTYYWRVRAADAATDQIIHSWWSEPQSFTVAPGPGTGVELIAPEDGATGVALTDIPFSWTSVASADEYDWVLSANADLSSPIATSEGLTTTAATYTGTLEYETPYFWQVTALKDGVVISTSTIGTFTTALTGQFCCPQCGLCFDTQAELEAHIAEMHPAQPATPTWVWVVIAIGAVLVIVVIVLIFRTRRV